jgi:hypothetical protein
MSARPYLKRRFQCRVTVVEAEVEGHCVGLEARKADEPAGLIDFYTRQSRGSAYDHLHQ